jgi:hypothetical protein
MLLPIKTEPLVSFEDDHESPRFHTRITNNLLSSEAKTPLVYDIVSEPNPDHLTIAPKLYHIGRRVGELTVRPNDCE